MRWFHLGALLCGFAVDALAAHPVLDSIDARAARYAQVAEDIWGYAELGYRETRSSARLRGELERSGFTVQVGVAGLPTSFLAEAGHGAPVIAFLAEFDALPGMSQAALPFRQPLAAGAAGHACGHHLFGTASVAAAVAVADWLAQSGSEGTVRVYGTPAEEGGSGKVYMTRAGLFDDADVVLHWHPSDRNAAVPSSTTANKSGRFEFHGQAAHAAAAPERGRSALDAVEAMDFMVNLMREHIPQDARIHYVITHGGDAPNVVPEFAEVYYYVRHPRAAQVVDLFQRVVQAAEGAAQGTGTQMRYEVMHGNFPVLPNETLSRVLHDALSSLPGIEYDAQEFAFAREIRKTLLGESLPLGSERTVQPFGFEQRMGSTDVGDVSWNAPTAGLVTATWVPGTPAHSWQAVAAGGTSIGTKGMLLAAKALALAAAREEFLTRRGADFVYEPLLGDRSPPLDYRE